MTDSYLEQSDDWIVQRCQSGDDAAFAELVRRYRGAVFRLALSVLGHAFVADAEDVAQDVLLRVHHGLRSFRGESTVGSWIYRITFNHALNIKARVRFRAPHLGDDALDVMPSPDGDPVTVLDDRQRTQALLACLDELPDVYQVAVRLHYWLGVSVRDIGVMLDAPEGTVKSYLHRARRLLHGMLATRGFDVRR